MRIRHSESEIHMHKELSLVFVTGGISYKKNTLHFCKIVQAQQLKKKDPYLSEVLSFTLFHAQNRFINMPLSPKKKNERKK